MSNNKLMSEIKNMMPDLVDSNRNFRTILVGKTGARNLDNSRIEILRAFVDLLKNSRMISNETREYLFDRYITIKGVTEKLNAESGAGGKVYLNNTVTSKIAYDRAKLSRIFGEDFLVEVVGKSNNKKKLDDYRQILGLMYIEYGSQDKIDIREEVLLPLDKKSLNTKLSDSEFEQFIGIIAPYFKSQVKAVADSIDKKSIGYFNFISTSPVLSDKDKERLQRLRVLMGLDDEQMVSDIDDIGID